MVNKLEMSDITIIKIKRSVGQRLLNKKKIGESYSEVIDRLCDQDDALNRENNRRK